ncbi:MAG: DMT family transporter [Ruminococcaceae bacterium]|nr:DMT family transporter [Oscillospiraceae bacterium]
MIRKLVSNKIFASLTAIFCCALWGISTPIVKMGYNHIDEAHVPSLLLWVGIQFIVAGFLTIGIYSIFSKKILLPKKENVKGVVIVSVLQTVLQYALLYIGLSQTTSVKGAILKSTDVFFVALIASLIFKMEKLTAKKLISCVIGFLGIVIMNLDGLSFNMNFLGDGLVIIGILSYSFSVIMTKLFAQKENPIVLCGYQMGLGGVVLSIIGFVLDGKFDFVGMLPIFVGLSLIYAVSYTLWTILLKYNPASSVTIYSFMTPVFGVIFSALLLSEDGGVAIVNLIIALVLVCIGIILWGYEKGNKNCTKQ